jgi:hypothetical protein
LGFEDTLGGYQRYAAALIIETLPEQFTGQYISMNTDLLIKPVEGC